MNTLLIPTFNRPPELSRLLDYLSDETFPIIVLDSSSPYNQALNAEVIDHFCDGNVAHLTFSEDTGARVKWTQGLMTVWTPYVSFCADDDFVYPHALRECCAALERDPLASLADGVHMGAGGGGLFVQYDAPAILEEEPIRRVENFLTHYNPAIYSVWRTELACKIWQDAIDETSDHFWELFVGVCAAAAGKRLRLPCTYYTQEAGPPFEELNKKRTRWHPLSWTRDGPHDMDEYFACYIDHLVAFTGLWPGALAHAHSRFYAGQGVSFDGAHFSHGRSDFVLTSSDRSETMPWK